MQMTARTLEGRGEKSLLVTSAGSEVLLGRGEEEKESARRITDAMSNDRSKTYAPLNIEPATSAAH